MKKTIKEKRKMDSVNELVMYKDTSEDNTMEMTTIYFQWDSRVNVDASFPRSISLVCKIFTM